MKILLVNPPFVKADNGVWRDVASIMPPLGLAWIAAWLEREGHDVTIIDAHAEHVGLDQLPQRLRAAGEGFELIGATATTALIGNALRIARFARQIWPGARIVLGGVHPTVLPEEVLQEPAVDAVARGEGEITMTELASGRDFASVDGISYRDGDTIRHNPERELIPDLNDLPFPAYHLLPMKNYHPAAGSFRRLPAISMLATRGCPGRCTFCYRIFGPRLRVRSGRLVAQEVQHLQQNYGIREICFYDDTFSAVRKEVLAFCEAIHELGIDLTWNCFARVDTVNPDVLAAMKKAGCHQIMYGVEAASPEVLKNINKKADAEQAMRAVRLTQEAGIDVRAAFMLGNPGETEKTMQETIDFAVRLNPEIAIFNITTPYPGTEMHAWAAERDCLMTTNWEDYDLAKPVMRLPTLDPEIVQKYYKKAYRRFYLRPGYALMRLRKIRTLDDVKEAMRAARAVLGIG